MPEIENLWLEGEAPGVFQTHRSTIDKIQRLKDARRFAWEPDVFNIAGKVTPELAPGS